MEKEEIIKNIEDLFIKWQDAIMFDSTGRAGLDEYDELISYCKEYIEEFKEFAHETLSHPAECCYLAARLCNELLENSKNLEVISKEDLKHLIEKETNKEMTDDEFGQLLKQADITPFTYSEYNIFSNCNKWLNYFNNTENVDYYKDYIEYKEYLKNHYIGWNPFKEDDPNPTYEEFLANKEKYQI